jgi:hypothetical protein
MSKSLVLDAVSGQLQTTAIVPAVAFRPELHYKEVTYPNANTIRISYYTNSAKTTELYRITLTRTNGIVTGRVDNDYTQSITRTTSYTRTNGIISSVEVS